MNKTINQLLSQAGIETQGLNPWDITIHDDRFYEWIIQNNSLGLGEAYIEGFWDCERVDEFIERILSKQINNELTISFQEKIYILMHKLFNFQTKAKASEVALKHYDIGNTLYQAMLGKIMNYSCAYWKKALTLEEAQIDKMELICQKLDLQQGMRLLDIGCGFGELALYAAKNYGVEVVGTTLSLSQKLLAEEKCRHFPIKIILEDYRDLDEGVFDRIVSVGMFEHVGEKNYRTFMEVIAKQLSDKGVFLLHTIGGNVSYRHTDRWVNKYIFPNGMIPSIAQLGQSIEGVFIMEDWHNFGLYYDRTLMEWYKNFNNHWPELKSQYDERFKRMWNYYLLSCAGAFRARGLQLWQIVLTKQGLKKIFRKRDL